MENNNGALAFDVLIRDSNINEMLSRDEQRIMQFTERVEGQSQEIVGSFDGIGRAIGGIAVGAMLQSWVSDIVSVRGEFQQLEIAFNTMLGSAEKGTALLNQLVGTAASTPFDLKGIAGNAKQLLAYGESAEKVNDTLVMLGNIASGLSMPLNDLVYLYGTTMVQGRLFTQDVRQFMGRGIPLVQELAKELGKTTTEINEMVTAGQIGFPEVQKVLTNLTSEGGMFYGLMEEQSKSLTGQISNLGDSFDMMLNEIGQSSEGILSGGISAAAYLVDNYEQVISVLGGLVTLYGTYRVALAAVAVQQGKSTGVAKIDAIVQKSRTGMLTSITAITRNHIAQYELMTKAQQAYTIELQKTLTLEQQENILRGLKTNAIAAVLTQEQKQYLSRLNLNNQSVEYLAAAQSILTADQRMAVEKQNLTRNSMAYGVAVELAVKAQMGENAATMQTLRTQAAALKQKEATLLAEYRISQNKIQSTRVQIALAQAEGNAEAVAALKQQQHNQLKQHSIIISDLKAARLAKEAATQQIATLATQQASIAGKAKAASDAMQTTSTTLLSTATTFLTAKLKALWATLIANPFTAIISVIGLAVSALMMFGKQEEENTTIAGEFQDAVSESYSKLNLYFSILKNASANTKEYKDALSKINSLCREHQVAVLEENAALEQQIRKHDELIEAVERSAAAKIRAKYIEEEYVALQEKQKKVLEELQENAKSAEHKEVQMTSSYDGPISILASEVVDVASTNIQNATNALWASVLAQAVEGSEKLQGLTGDAYNKAYNELVSNILTKVQDTTKATDKEMEAFKESITKAVKQVVADTQLANENVALINDQTAKYFSGSLDNNIKEEIDITKLSLEDLHKVAGQLNGTTIGIDLKLYGYDDAMTMLNDVNEQITTKQGALNTENDINAEIKRLKDWRAKTQLGTTEWKNLDGQIQKLEAKLPKTHKTIQNTAQKTADILKDLAQEEIDLQLDVEQSKVNIIKDGYEKRKAELEIQHRQELARIDKEQKELEDKYKKVGKAIPASVNSNFDELRANANASYELAQLDLIDTEISEKRKLYEQYYKWLEAYGKEVADNQYADLIKAGNTYTQWLEGKVSALVEKESHGGLTENDSNALIQYQQQLKSVKGVKSEMDKFNESLEKAKDNSQTLGERIISLTKIKADLQAGKGGLIGEDRAKAMLQVEQQITEATTELQNQLLETYKSNAQLRYEAELKYDEQITWLKQHGYDEQAKLAEKAKTKTISEIDATAIQATSDWKTLFENASYLGGKAFEEILQKLRKMVEGIKDVDIKGALLKQLDGLESQTQGSKNPFKQLTRSIKEYNKATDGSIEKSKKFSTMFSAVGATVDMVKGSFDAIVGGLKDLGLAGDEVTQEMLGDISNMLGGTTQLAKGIASGNPVDIISGGVSLVTSAISIFDSSSRRIKREMKAHGKQLGVLQREYKEIEFEINNAVGEDYYKEQRKAQVNLRKQAAEYKELARLEQSKDSKDRDDGKVQEYLSSAKDAEMQIKEIEKEISETLLQTNFRDLSNELAEAWADAFSGMEDSAEKFDDIWNTTIANAVKNTLKLKLIEPVVNEFTEALAAHMGANNNSVAGFNFDNWKKMLQNAGEAFTNGLEGFEEFFRDMGDEVENASETLEGQIKGVSEDTASIIAGEMQTIRIRQMEHLLVSQGIQSTLISVDNTIKSAITYLSSIAQNTSYCRQIVDIKGQLEDIKSTLASDPLRAKGL